MRFSQGPFSSMNKRIQIVGGGFSGLTQAFYLVEKGFKPVILERKNRLGGLLGSHRHQSFLVEQGANAFLANAELERLSRIMDIPLISTQKKSSRKFIYRNGKKCRQPLFLRELGLPLMFFLKGGFGRAIGKVKARETLKQWGQRNLGEAATRFVLEPAMQGVFAVSSDQLDADLVLNAFANRSPRGRMKGSVTPGRGMQQWIDRMKFYLESHGCEFVMNYKAEINDCCPTLWAVDLASLKKISEQGKGDLPCEIQKTKTASLSSVTLMFENENFNREGFGCLFPRGLGFHSLGVLFNHNIFKGRVPGGSSETWILGDQIMGFSGMSEQVLLRYVLSDRYQLTGFRAEPGAFKVFQWPDSLPVYDRNLGKFIKALDGLDREKRKDLFVGNYLGRLGLSEILLRAKANAEKVAGGYFG